jgi:hypothetical protein
VRKLAVRASVHLTFRASPLPNGGYYYGLVVLKPYKRFTRSSPPPCSTSSDMQRTEYGYPQPSGTVSLTLTPSPSATNHWCRGGVYAGAIYAVPQPPPCNGEYPCYSEPHEKPCAGLAPGCVHGVAPEVEEYAYPDTLPAPRANGTTIVARFTVKVRR